MAKETRLTKIVFTIGPATEDEETLERLIRGGVDICRLNMAHADRDWVLRIVKRVRSVCDRVNRQIAFMMDVKGPEIRTGDIDGKLELKEGQRFDFLTSEDAAEDGDVPQVTVNYPDFISDLSEGDIILVDNGLMRFKVLERGGYRIRCEVVTGGTLTSRRHINLPGIKVALPSLTEKDIGDMETGVEAGVEFFALSFVREAADIEELRAQLRDRKSNAMVIAKIEDRSGVSNVEAIIHASDGVMVARGDLGIEVPFEDLPLIQTRMVELCKKHCRPVIVATHMLESMIHNRVPTRAEVTDVANAVREQADCVMLSGETTVGEYPVECVEVMKRIITKIQENSGIGHNETLELKTPKVKMLRAAVVLAGDLGRAGILVFTQSGWLARHLSALRPRGCPIYAFTDKPELFKQMLILWGVEPFLMEFDQNPEQSIAKAKKQLKEKGWVNKGDYLVVITNVLAGERTIDSLQIRRIDEAVEHHREKVK